MRLEPELWEALLEICKRERQDMSSIVRVIEQRRDNGGRTSAVRVFVLTDTFVMLQQRQVIAQSVTVPSSKHILFSKRNFNFTAAAMP